MTPFSPSAAIRTALAGGLALALMAACTTPQPAYPVRLETAPPPPAPPPPPPPPPPGPPLNDGSVSAAPSTPVGAKPLPPVGAPRALPPVGSAPKPGAALTPAPKAAKMAKAGAKPLPYPYGPAPFGAPSFSDPPPEPVVAPAANLSETTVGRGETLFDVAERVKTPVRSLIELNGLQPPYELPTGMVLRIPASTTYVVKPGDTLFGIARRFSVDPRSLANLNEFPLETSIRPKQKIALPATSRDQGPMTGAMGDAPPAAAMALASRPPIARPVTGALSSFNPDAPVPPPPLLAAEAADPPAPLDSQVAAAGKGRFVWPVRGEVLSGFGPKGPGQRNDGLNIATSPGEAVKASAAGEVAYAGELPGFGNLVLLKHPGGWVTAYAHLARLEVKMRDKVAQGQEVGQAGQTGQVDRPQLHFEVRYAANPREKARPVDPSLLLPGLG